MNIPPKEENCEKRQKRERKKTTDTKRTEEI